jgi:hypothetical protein
VHFTPTSHHRLAVDANLLAEPGRDLLRDHHPPSHPTRHLHIRQDLISAIETFIDGWNERCQPFVWTKPADDIVR